MTNGLLSAESLFPPQRNKHESSKALLLLLLLLPLSPFLIHPLIYG